MYAKKPGVSLWGLMLLATLNLACQSNAEECKPGGPGQQAPPKVKVKNVSVFQEYSDQSNETGSRIFVVHFAREVRNRSGVMMVPQVGGKTLRLRVQFTVGEVNGKVPGYDDSTTQLEIREWDSKNVDGFGDSPEERERTVKAFAGKAVRLELEICRHEYTASVTKVVDTKFINPKYQEPGEKPFEQLVLKLDQKIPHRSNGSFRATLWDKGELKYVSLFLYPTREEPQDQVYLDNELFELEMTPEQIAQGLLKRPVAIESNGGIPWQFLASPFPTEKR